MQIGFKNALSKAKELTSAKSSQRGQVGLMYVILAFVLGVILIFYVALPVLNTGITGTAANLTGYTGASGIANASYVVTILGVLALAAYVVMSLFRGGL